MGINAHGTPAGGAVRAEPARAAFQVTRHSPLSPHHTLGSEAWYLLAVTGVEDPVELVQVESLEDAERQRFLGSPTLRIDGVDVDPAANQRTDYGLKCRLYRSEIGQQPLPPDGWILAAIENAGAGSPTRGSAPLRPQAGSATRARE